MVLLCLVASLIILSLKKDISGFKIMLMGINITLFGSILALDSNSNFSGFQYLIALSGLVISAIGLLKKD